MKNGSRALRQKNFDQSALEPLLAQALTFAAIAVFITDVDGKIVWINDAFSRLSGYSPDEALGRTPAILRSGKQHDTFYAQLWQTILAGHNWKGEVVDQRKDGTLYTADEIITPLRNSEGTITHFIAIQHDITRRIEEGEQDHHLAYHDFLTDLPNRASFLASQNLSITNAEHVDCMFATLFLDLDNFKPVNDNLGHQIGDHLLAAVAARLRSAVRQTDIVARIGGDEFAILLTDIPNVEVVSVLACKLIDALSRPFVLDEQKIKINVSIGIAMYPVDGKEPEALLMHADNAMYKAKCRGGNNYEFYSAVLSLAP